MVFTGFIFRSFQQPQQKPKGKLIKRSRFSSGFNWHGFKYETIHCKLVNADAPAIFQINDINLKILRYLHWENRFNWIMRDLCQLFPAKKSGRSRLKTADFCKRSGHSFNFVNETGILLG